MNEENYAEAQVFEYQAKQLQQILETIDAQLVEINTIVNSLKELNKVKDGDEVLFPVANGMFVKGLMTSDKTLRINVGNNVVVEKSIPDAILMMEQQIIDIKEYKSQVALQMDSLISKLESMNNKAD